MTTAHYLLDSVGLWADIRCERPVEPGPILFVDRDGVLIEDRGYVGTAAETRVYPGAADAVAAARAMGYRVAIATNQSGIARGLYDWTGFAAVQAVIDATLARAGTAVDAVLACAYYEEGERCLRGCRPSLAQAAGGHDPRGAASPQRRCRVLGHGGGPADRHRGSPRRRSWTRGADRPGANRSRCRSWRGCRRALAR